MPDSEQRTAASGLLTRIPPLSAVRCLLSGEASAAYSSRDLFIPIFGRSTGGDGRRYETTFTITNGASKPAKVTLSFLRAEQENPKPFATTMQLAPRQTRRFDPAGAELLGAPSAFGARRIESDAPLLAHARLHSLAPNEAASRSVASSFNAIPQFSTGTGDSALLQGLGDPMDFRCKVYVVETTGQPLTFALALLDANGQLLAALIVAIIFGRRSA